jgi:hypothetical protein
LIRYADEYNDYYNRLKSKVRVKENNNKLIKQGKDDIYPKTKSNYGYNYRTPAYASLHKEEKKSFNFVDKFIIKLIVTLILFVGLVTLKVVPEAKAKNIYGILEKEINRTYDYSSIDKNLNKVGINLGEVITTIEEKYNNVIEEISTINDFN